MSRMIQVRDVPDSVHSLLRTRAAREGITTPDQIGIQNENALSGRNVISSQTGHFRY